MSNDIVSRVGGELQIKRSALRMLVGSEGGLDYLLDQPHTGPYVSVDKVRDLLTASIGREATSRLMQACYCPEEDLPDLLLSLPGTTAASIAAARLGMGEERASSATSRPDKYNGASGPASIPARRARRLGRT